MSCSIYKFFYYAPVGSTLLAYVQEVAKQEKKRISVDPIRNNAAWKKKLGEAENVVIGCGHVHVA